MNRKDLRTAESDWRATKQPSNRPYVIKKQSIRVTTILKLLAVITILILLYETNPMRLISCQTNVNKICMD